jgi:Fe-S-cluster containining protein
MGLPSRDRELVQIVDAALDDAARRAGPRLACCPRCTQCCHGAFAINELDAQRLFAGMETLRSQNPALAADIEHRATLWIAEHGPGFPGDLNTGRLGQSDADQSKFEEFANEAACPALGPATGLCDVYEWRPMTCRVFGPPIRMQAPEEDSRHLAHCELCFDGANTEEIAACEMPVPHELEQELLNEFPNAGDTLVAFALLRSNSKSNHAIL